jgi:hypothetical protein
MAIRDSFGATWLYNSGLDQWDGTGNPMVHDGSVRASCKGGFVTDREAYRFGGRTRAGGVPVNTVETFKYSDETWSALNNFPVSFMHGWAVPLITGPEQGKILVGGGATSGPTINHRCWLYNAANDTYVETTSTTSATYHDNPIGAIQLTNGLVYFAGGSSTYNGAAANKTSLYDPSDESWSVDTVGNLPFAVKGDTSSMGYHPDGTVYIIRGTGCYYGTFS